MQPDQDIIDDVVLSLLVCPIDHQRLLYVPVHDLFYNPRLKKSYPIRNSIPVMLVEEALDVSDADDQVYLKSSDRFTGPQV